MSPRKSPPGSAMPRRNELARARGFVSYAQQRKFSRDITNGDQLNALPPAAQEARQGALDAIALARRQGIPLEQAARKEGSSIDSIRWWASEAVERNAGTWRPRAADRLYRPMYGYTAGQTMAIDVRGSRAASDLGAYHAAIGAYLRTGDSSALERFAGKKIGGVELETNPDVIDELARRGEFDFETIYRDVA